MNAAILYLLERSARFKLLLIPVAVVAVLTTVFVVYTKLTPREKVKHELTKRKRARHNSFRLASSLLDTHGRQRLLIVRPCTHRCMQ
jgi:hypothetical protein